MTISESLKLASTKLNAGRIDNPPLEAEILLSGLLKKPREFSLTHGEKQLSKTQIAKYQRLLEKRLRGEPIAYLTSQKEFYGLNFMINKNVLIPRPETELIVAEALKLVRRGSPVLRLRQLAEKSGQLTTRNSPPVTLVDVGTGSGCIIITLAKLLNQELKIMSASWRIEFIGLDISQKALTVAKQNARIHNVDKKIKFLKGSLLKPILNSKFVIRNSKLIILANLPYGWQAWKNNCSLDSAGLKYEPDVALFTGKRGLELYEKLLKQINQLINSHKFASDSSIFVFFEFDPRQTKIMKKLIKQELSQAKFQIKKDLSGLNRLALITIPARRAS